MENRGQKRTEVIEPLPADKRACSSLEFRASSSNSPAPVPMSSSHESHDTDMDTSSSASGSTRSDGDGDRDSTYGSYESDYSLRDYYRRRSPGDQSKFKKVLSNLSEELDESGQLAALTELCELLSFCSDSSLSGQMVDSFSSVLVKLARHESNPDIMLLAIRAITYLCDANPRSPGFLVRHDAIPALCQRLIVIEYLDVAEQCLQALEKISSEQPLACLQSGAMMAVLTYIDFFSTSIQRVALSTVVNICKKLSSESPLPSMEAVPILCNLLQYEDTQLVESVATCLIKIGEQTCHTSDMLDEICKHGLVEQVLHILNLNSRTTLCQLTYIGLIGLLTKVASGSSLAFRTMFELNVSSILKDMLAAYDLSHGTTSTPMVDGQRSQIHEVLKFLNELLPPITKERNVELVSDKETFLTSQPHTLQRFGVDLLPGLIQVINSGANIYICYGCLSVINKLVYFSRSDVLQSFLQAANFSSFLAGVLTRKDHHLMLLALQIVDTILLKLPHVYLNSFIKEGVLFSIHALLSSEQSLQAKSPVFDPLALASDGRQKVASRDVKRCPCFVFDTDRSLRSQEAVTCKLEVDTIPNLAKHIWTNYFEKESVDPEKGVTDTLQQLRYLSVALSATVDASFNDVASDREEEETTSILHQIISELNGRDPISTFEFVESGIVRALIKYLRSSNGQHLGGRANIERGNLLYVVERRFEVFGRLLLSSGGPSSLTTLVQRLQSALSSVENFPVIPSYMSKLRSSYATVPYGRSTSYPCLKVQFVKEEGEICLRDYAEDVVSVDPFLPLDVIEAYFWPKVSPNRSSNSESGSHALKKENSSSHPPLDPIRSEDNSPDLMETRADDPLMQEENSDLRSSPGKTSNLEKEKVCSTEVTDFQIEEPVKQALNGQLNEVSSPRRDHPGSSENEGTSPKLSFYLDGQKLDRSLTLYQSILKLKFNAEHDISRITKLWSQIYKITYRNTPKTEKILGDHCQNSVCSSSSSGRAPTSYSIPIFSSLAVPGFDTEEHNPTYDVLSLLRSLEEINRFKFHLISRERINAFAEGRIDDLNELNLTAADVSQNEFLSSKLTEKLEQQMRDPLSVSVGGMPSWCTQLMAWCPFLFAFEAKCKYFHLAALGRSPLQTHTMSHVNVGTSGRHQSSGNLPRKKFMVHRNAILDSAAQMMEVHARQKVVLEVEYSEEVGTGLGPTLEFYTLVCQEFQKSGMGLWRDDGMFLGCVRTLKHDNAEILASPFGLFPRPWSPSQSSLGGIEFSEVIKKFSLLGQIVAKALQDGRILDLPFSRAFYKLVLGKELTVYDIQSFDPGFAKTLLEFQALVEKKRYLESQSEKYSCDLDLRIRSTRIDDLCLDFTLPGYPHYTLNCASESEMVNLGNLEEYVSLVVDATVRSGICRQVEAFKSGFDQVFPIKHLQIFTEEELERLLCGEHVLWNSNELLDHIKFDHGYTVSSPPVVNLLEIMLEFNHEQQRAFLQFVTGAPRLPTGGLASLNPRLTIVRKHCNKSVDAELPSVMTCANYLKLPPYSSKEIMKEKLLYAITEGQGSFHLS